MTVRNVDFSIRPKPLSRRERLDYSAGASNVWQAMLISGISGRSDDRRVSRRPRARAREAAFAGLVCATGLALAWPAAAEPYRLGGDPVVVDYGVLESLGPPVPEATSVPSVPTIRRAPPPGYGPTVQLKPPPSKPPQSTLTAEQPPEETAPAPSQSAGLSETIDELTQTETASDAAPTPPPPPSEIEPPPEPESAAPAEDVAEVGTVDESSAAEESATPETELESAESSEFAPPVDEGMESTAESTETAAAAEEPAVETPEPPAPETTAAAPAEATAAEAPPAEEGSQTAALPPAATAEGQMRIEFPEGSAEIPESARQALDGLATQLNGDEAMRVQLLAYASGSADAASRARRMSLSRALAVRAYLIAQGVRSTRMDVRALGNNVEGDPADRVDIIPQAQ